MIMSEFGILFQPIKIGTMEVKNRFVMPPIATNYCEIDGSVTERLKAYLGLRARGGVGLIIVEAAYVQPSGKLVPNEVGVYKDELIDGLKGLVNEIHQYETKAALQLVHAGRQTFSAMTGFPLVAPSPISCPFCQEMPKEMTLEDIEGMIDAFGKAAGRAKDAGFDTVEIHGAHGYLVNQFLSPYSNQRTDQYGGSPENRARFPLEVLRRIREEVGENFPVIYRMSSVEYVPGGLTIEDTREFAGMLVENGIDALHVSLGVYETAAMIIQPAAIPQGVNVENAAAIKEAVNGRVPVIAVGRIKEPVMAEQIIESGKADLVSLGRALVADPEFPSKTIAGKPEEIRRCIACNQGCIDRVIAGLDMKCQVNALTGREYEYDLSKKAARKKRVLVVGGGPGGLEAARVAAMRGHEVFLYEKSQELGGQLHVAAIPPHKSETKELIDYLVPQVDSLGVNVKVGEEVDEKVLDTLKPDAVIVATGSTPIVPDLPGIETMKRATAREVLAGDPGAFSGNVVVVGGGLTGCETAEFLADTGAKVTVVEMQHDVIPDVGLLRKLLLMDRMNKKGIKILTQRTAKEIKTDGLVVEKDGHFETISEVDALVWAVGNKPETGLEKLLGEKNTPFYKVGDCVQPRKIMDAIHEGFLCAYEL
jgi:2,4-dienoyl-CoA reductase-like NADH-dependent reductase (Old Yellow Enzyme family)/NADPH-dependent 2,4-dienoyl-CoA reductase/sulfur reductase-like enzyme